MNGAPADGDDGGGMGGKGGDGGEDGAVVVQESAVARLRERCALLRVSDRGSVCVCLCFNDGLFWGNQVP
jgi:hypothetical protein